MPSHTEQTTELKLNFLDSPMSSDCIERDLGALMDGFNIAAIPEKTNPRSPTNLEIKK